MAHFAQLDAQGNVLRVMVVADADTADSDGMEKEEVGVEFLKRLCGGYPHWKQCSYNGRIRKNYPAPGYKYDAERDAFIPPKPFDSWVLDEATCRWVAPIPYPDDGGIYWWDESTRKWQGQA